MNTSLTQRWKTASLALLLLSLLIARPAVSEGVALGTGEINVPGGMARSAMLHKPPEIDNGPLLALGGFSALTLTLGTAAALRHRLRSCPRCKTRMIRFDEEGDDVHLSAAERAEERIGSANYDIWACPGCGEIAKLRYSRFFTGYAQCPECGAKTKSRTSVTLSEPSDDAEELVRIEESCEHCPYRASSLRKKPRLQWEDADA